VSDWICNFTVVGLEALAMAAPHVQFVLNVSSVGLYAARAGCRVRTFVRHVLDREPGFKELVEQMPDAYRAAVEPLD